MAKADDNAFLFISHASADKTSPKFLRVLERLHAAGIPMGIDRPYRMKGLSAEFRPEDFVWGLDGRHEDWLQHVMRAMANGACGIVVLASSNTGPDSYVWQELLIAQTLRVAIRSDYGFFLLALEPDAHQHVPPSLRSSTFVDATDELDGEILRMLTHLEDERKRRTAQAPERRLVQEAMRATIRNMSTIRLVGGPRVPLDAIFTPLRGDTLASAERTAAHDEFFEPAKERIDLQGPASHHDRTTRLGAAIAARLKESPIMPGMQQGLAASLDPWAVAGAATTLSDVVEREGHVVILGEPAAGKTTLLRWLALRFAEVWAALDEPGEGVEVKALLHHVDPSARPDQEGQPSPHVSLGPARLPIFLSVPDLSANIRKFGASNLLPFLAMQLASLVDPIVFPDREQCAHRIVQDALEKGQLLVLLDGLDEVDEADRPATIALIEQFAETWTNTQRSADPSRNNRLIVTSRIVGYHALPLSAEWPHVVVDRMTPAVVRQFWERLYRSGGFADVADAKAKAAALHRSVYAHTRKGLADLAGIPLLATLLAVVFQQDEHFPEHRAQIYERAFACILKEQRQEQRKKLRLEADQVARWLAPLAYDLQGSDGPALIERPDLVRKLIDRHKEIDTSPLGDMARAQLVADFLEENERSLGLLVERSPTLWAFVHRTFQEYFAGIWLAESMERGEVPPAQLTDPRWREPLLLLLGSSAYAGEKNKAARDALFKTLLDAPKAPAERARVGRFLIEALWEMPDLPGDSLLARVVCAALADLAGQEWETIPAFARARAISSLYAFGRRDAAKLEGALIALLDEGPADIARVVAHIVLDRHWCTVPLETALQKARMYDALSAGLPVLQALQQMTSERHYGELGASGKFRAAEGQSEAQRKALLEGLEMLAAEPSPKETIYGVVQRRADRGRYAYFSRFDLFDREVDAFLKRDYGAPPTETPADRGERRALDCTSRRDLQALLGVALDHGFEYRGRIATYSEHRRLLHFISLPNAARHSMLEFHPELRMTFGADDPIYRIAVNLDLFLEPTFAEVALPYVAHPSRLARCIAPDLPGCSWQDQLRRILLPPFVHRMRPAEHRAKEVFAQALFDTTGSAPLSRLVSAMTDAQRDALNLLLRSILLSAREVVLEAGHYLTAHLVDFANGDERVAMQALETASAMVRAIPLRVSDSVQSTTPRLFAERIAYRLLGLEANDARYATALSLDAQARLPATDLLPVLQALPESVTMAWAERQSLSTAGAPWPIDLDSHETTLAVFDMAHGIDAGDDMRLRSAQASTIFDRLRTHDSLQAASIAPFAVLPRSVLAPWSVSLDEAGETVRQAGNPYHEARFALGRFEAMVASDGVDIAARLLPAIDNAVLRLDIAERLSKLVPDRDADRFRTIATDAARAIAAPAQRWRALLRLAWQPGYPEQALLAQALAAVDAIDDPTTLRLDASIAIRLVSQHPGLVGRPMPMLRNKAIPAWIRHRRFAPGLVSRDKRHGDAAAILYVAQTCRDLLDEIERSGRASVDASPDAPGKATRDNAYSSVDLTVALAEKILVTAQAEDPASLDLPSVAHARRTRITCGFSIYACERWLDRPEHPLAWIAALAIVKRRPRRDRRVLEPLLNAIRGDDEELAAQAAWMLSRGSILARRDQPDSSFDDMGLETLLWAARRATGADPHGLSEIVAYLVRDMEVKGSALPDRLFAHLKCAPEDEAAVMFILEHLTWADPAATEALIAQVRDQNANLQASMIVTLGSIDHTQRIEREKKAEVEGEKPEIEVTRPIAATQLAQAIRSLEPADDPAPFRILERGGTDLCALVERICRDEAAKASRFDAFKRALESARIDIRHPLSNPDTAFPALKAFFGAGTYSAGEALPFRHDRSACQQLRRTTGADAVHFATELLVDLVSRQEDLELAGLVATMCIEFALDTPSLVASALKTRLGGEHALMTFLAALIAKPPRGITTETAVTLTCLLRSLDQSCTKALIEVSGRPDIGNWALLEQSLLGVGRLDRSVLPLVQQTLSSKRPRTALLAVRLLGILARDAGSGTDIRTAARRSLDAFCGDARSGRSIFLFIPAMGTKEDGCILNCGTLASIARTELFLAEGVAS